jgi:catalase
MPEQRTLTTESGAPVTENQFSQSAGAGGPLLIQDQQLIEKLARFNRERIPERVAHPRGSGAYGHFTVTNPEISKYTSADFLGSEGRRTELFHRFSTVGNNLGSSDAVRDVRGFAVKFYTREGNYDLVGNNTPIFFLNDPVKFPDFIHTQKRDPHTGMPNTENKWDFWSLYTPALHQVTILFSDRGIPASYRHMHGFGSHTFQWVNAAGEIFWVKYHFKTDQGIKNLTDAEAEALQGKDTDSHQRDLFTSIERGDFPSWSLKVQIMPAAEAATYRFNPFDVTRTWSQQDYPLIDVGTMVLDRNPENIFAEVEQSAFNPANFVPGIGPSPDRMLQGRLFAYGDAHRYRIGVNHTQLPVNAPRGVVADNYGRDGSMAVNAAGRQKNYEPNSFDGPVQTNRPLWAPQQVSGVDVAQPVPAHAEDDDFVQAGDLFRLLTAEERARLVGNIGASLGTVERTDIVERMIDHFTKADPEYGAGVREAVNAYRVVV